MLTASTARYKTTALFIVLALATILSYFKFQTFKPTGLSSELTLQNQSPTLQSSNIDFPTLPNSEELSFTSSSNSSQLTYQTKESLTGAYNFYRNVLLSDGWQVKEEFQNPTSYVTKYVNGEQIATISITTDDSIKETIVGVELRED